MLASEHHRDESQGGEEESPPPDPEAGRRVTEFKVGDKIAAATRTGNSNPALRVGVIERIHERTYAIGARRFTIRTEDGRAHIVSEDRSVHIEADEHHTMDELYEYRMVYNAIAAQWFNDQGKAVKSWYHHDGEPCFGGGWFIVCLNTPDGWATNHYKAEHWDLFQVPEVDLAPEWDGHTPAIALERLRNAL
jgi:hypothetical protein